MTWGERWHARRVAAARRDVDRLQVALEIATAYRNRLDPPVWAPRVRRELLCRDPDTDPEGLASIEEWGPLG